MNKYNVLAVVGEGAYGVVLKCQHRETNEIVAIKKFKEPDTNEAIRKTSIREVKILRMLNHPNIVKLSEAFRRKDRLCLVFEFVDFSLLELIEKHPGGLDRETVRSHTYQILKATAFLHSLNIVHRDIKPENLLVTKEGDIKLCDFGFARTLGTEGSPMTSYVATRWYRSPELLVTPVYGKPVDLWAVGCIMAEMLTGDPLFPGDNLLEQIDTIQQVLGNFPGGLRALMKDNSALKDAKLREIPKPETLEKKFRGKVCPEGLQLLKGLLELDPEQRIDAEAALAHPYFDSMREKPRAKEHSPIPIPEKRVHSSTYRTGKYSQADAGEEDGDNLRRHPSHSNERTNHMRATGLFLNDTSRLSANHEEKKNEKKGFTNTRLGQTIKDSQVFQPPTRKEGSASRREDFGKPERQDSLEHKPAAKKRTMAVDPKKSTSNFRMFRIREEEEYDARRIRAHREYIDQTPGSFLPHLQHQHNPPTSKRSEYTTIYGTFNKPSHKYDRKSSKQATGTNFYLVGNK